MSKTVTVDVREDIRQGREPFSKIMNAVADLRDDEEFLLIAPFEPVPLFHLLEERGFQHAAQAMDSGDWQILFKRRPRWINSQSQIANSQSRIADSQSRIADSQSRIADSQSRIADSQSAIRNPQSAIVDVDVRGFEPPQPMVMILEILATLPDNALLRARTDRRPMHLYAQLEARGFVGQTEEQTDGSFLTHIRRR